MKSMLLVLLFAFSALCLQHDFRRVPVGIVREFTIIGIDEQYLIVSFVLTSEGRSFFVESVRSVPDIHAGDSLFLCFLNYQKAGICTQAGKIYTVLKNTK